MKCAAFVVAAAISGPAMAYDVSSPAILQWYEATYQTMQYRTADFFAAGYGAVWTPPPYRADSGNGSVGYDVWDRFDLGSPGNPTLYGTETGLKTAIKSLQRVGGNVYLDLVWNHTGFEDSGTPGFAAAGGYPGFVLSASGLPNGDFHAANATGDLDGRISGLNDIDQSTNIQLIRSPVVSGNPQNIPAGTTPLYGRIANVPDVVNKRFYPDTNGPFISVYDPKTGESNIKVYSFNTADPTAGDAVAENGLGYLMRNSQWLIQTIGADGFRLDATKNYPAWALNYLDRAIYRQSTRYNLDGTQRNPFSFGEYYDGNSANIQPTIRKDINPATPGVIGGNRDALDFPLYFAMQSNLSTNGVQNSWFNLVNASLDRNDDGLANNGSQGVAFVQSHDGGGAPPGLPNVAYAYTLMRPGQSIVYFNAQQFGTNRSFPGAGRGDALGGLYGNTITTLVDIRNRYGNGNYAQRLLEKELLVYERSDSALVCLSNRVDAGFDTRTVLTSFPAGTPLLELTGNAGDPTVDPGNNFSKVVVVGSDGSVTIKIPRNLSTTGVNTGKGYLIYGPSGPQGTVTLGGTTGQIGADTPTATTNGSARLSAIDIVKGNTMTVSLQTVPVTLLNIYRDALADGNSAIVKFDGGLDINGNGVVDNTATGNVGYGFENFVTKSSPLIAPANGTAGDGQFIQTVDTTGLSEGMHYIEVRAFRSRGNNEPPIYTSWKKSIYVDRLKPTTVIQSYNSTAGIAANRTVIAQSTDLTANNVHILLDLPAGLTEAQVLSRLNGTTQATQIDTDLWSRTQTNLTSGNHVLTLVSYEIDGNFNIQRYPGQLLATTLGSGLCDLNFDGTYSPADVGLFFSAYNSNQQIFNAAGDLNGDGLIDDVDLLAFGPKLVSLGASTATLSAYNRLVGGLVPEPSGICFVAIAMGLAFGNRRRSSLTPASTIISTSGNPFSQG